LTRFGGSSAFDVQSCRGRIVLGVLLEILSLDSSACFKRKQKLALDFTYSAEDPIWWVNKRYLQDKWATSNTTGLHYSSPVTNVTVGNDDLMTAILQCQSQHTLSRQIIFND
jgi:hypothetical protein